MVIWIKPLRIILALPYNKERNVLVQLDADWGFDPKLFDDNYLRSRFNPPSDRQPPAGGVARHWLNEPERWKWMGWINWQCNLGPGAVAYQQFQNGKIIGSLRSDIKGNDGQLYAILNDGKWNLLEALNKAKSCI